MHILVIEDDPSLGETLRQDLVAAGFAVDVVRDGTTGEFVGMTDRFDLAILDLGLPGMSGLEVLRRWRQAGNAIPVLILSARDAWHEKIDGFKAGADDYLGKPFHKEELLYRVKSLLKRSYGRAPVSLESHGLRLDETNQRVIFEDGRTEDLTATEFRLLQCFMLHPGKLLSKAYLMESAYESGMEHESNVVEVYINRLRKKLGNTMISTRRGQGYVFGPEHPDDKKEC